MTDTVKPTLLCIQPQMGTQSLSGWFQELLKHKHGSEIRYLVGKPEKDAALLQKFFTAAPSWNPNCDTRSVERNTRPCLPRES